MFHLKCTKLARREFLQRNVMAGFASAALSRLAVCDEKERPSLFKAAEFNHIALDTPKRNQAIEFYEQNFGMTNISHGRTVRDTFLHFEKGFMNLGEASNAGINHFCLGIEKFDRDTVFRTLNVIGLNPFLMGGNNLHIYDPDGLNVQIQEIGHGYARMAPSDLTQSKAGVFETMKIHCLSLTVTDVARSRDFYAELFGLKVDGEQTSDHCLMRVGSGYLELKKGQKAGMIFFGLALPDFETTHVIEKLKTSGIDGVAESTGSVLLKDSSGIQVRLDAFVSS